MAKVLQTTLQISESTVEQYCTADGLSLNTGGYAIRLYMNGHTRGSAILNDAAKEVLYPSATAHPFKIDSFIRANKSGGSMTISLQFNGTSVQSETGDWGSGLKNKTKEGISDPVVINSNRSTEIKWHIKGSSTVSRFSIASTRLTFYFNQYEMRPLVGNNANGIQKVTVSNASPCYGDTVVFTPKLVQGATWAGWYSDAACTNLVSADQNYSVSPSSDITLYAKATIDATLYNVSAVAGTESAGVNVSDSIVPKGSTTTFTAQVNTGCSFEAWYSDNTYTTVVSTENPYTSTITADTTLYAKAHRNSFDMSVGSAEHGTASVSATTVPYGSDVTFTFTPEDETWELYGWYSDSGLTQLVSEANPYTFAATEDVTLYPKVGKKRYTITLQWGSHNIQDKGCIAAIDFNRLDKTEVNYLKNGEYDKIDPSKVFDYQIKDGEYSAIISKTLTISIRCPYDMYVAICVPNYIIVATKYYRYIRNHTWWPYYWYQPTEDATFVADITDCADKSGYGACNCIAIAKEGISSTDATTPTLSTKPAIFTAIVETGYEFAGWYSDAACTSLVSTNNPASIITPQGKWDDTYWKEASLTLYAKATKAIYTIGVGTAEHGSASVSATTAHYGDTVTFNCTVDEDYEFKGWYSDEGLTQLVSEAANYEHTVTGSITLWPKVEIITYKITFQADYSKNFGAAEVEVNIAAIDFESLTRQEKEYLKTGNYNLISSDKVYDMATDKGNQRERTVSVSVDVPKGKYVAMYAPEGRATTLGNDRVVMFYIEDKTGEETKKITNWPYYWYEPTQDMVYSTIKSSYRCKCVAIPKEGISYVDATTPVSSPNEPDAMPDGNVYSAVFSAEISPGYEFSGWYSDEECTVLASPNNPAYIITPEADGKTELTYTLYAKATRIATGTGIYIKQNGTWKNALAVFKKTNDAWVQQNNPASLFTGSPSGTESNYLYLGE